MSFGVTLLPTHKHDFNLLHDENVTSAPTTRPNQDHFKKEHGQATRM
jgi:hypothetical protein